jgi:threonine aldolase
MTLVDLRSDTVTKPTDAMRAAMASAEVGDDVWGDDPTVNRLQSLAAAMVGTESALFVPSGTMGNQIAITLHSRPGSEVLCGARSHVYRAELAGAAVHAGAQMRPLPDPRGRLDPQAVRDAFPMVFHEGPPVTLLCIEDTYGAGGCAVPVAALDSVAIAARERGARVHLDGARLFNAAVALDVSPQQIVGVADTVMFCVSKGLGAPVGSLLCGPSDLVDEARLVRQRMGGGMRQAGVLAAAGIVALETMVAGLADDHVRARRLADALGEIFPGSVDPADVETNMVFAAADALPEKVFDRLADDGVLASWADARTVRFVTHHQVDDAGLEHAISVLRRMR